MIDKVKETLFQVAQDSAAPERDSPTARLKTWVTPRVITSSSENTESHALSSHNDGSSNKIS